MAVVEGLFYAFLTLFLPPVFVIFVISLVLTSFGKSLGLRRRYVKWLLKVFEYGRVKIENAERRRILSVQRRGVIDDDADFVFDGSSSEDEEVDSGIETPPPMPESGDHFLLVDQKNLANGLGIPSVIQREGTLLGPEPTHEKGSLFKSRSYNSLKEFHLDDALDFIKPGMEAIIDDEVTKRFAAEELASWNLMTRTNFKNYQFVSFRLTVIWATGCLFRYFILFPLRVIILCFGIWVCVSTSFVIGYLPFGSRVKRWLFTKTELMFFRLFARALTAIITYHDEQNKAKGGGVCVANHTSPIDIVMLAGDNSYALIGQKHGGFLGLLQHALGRASDHIWFERSEVKDRHLVANRLRNHVQDKDKKPILIFPEGTCINNTSVMQFKKGSFEVGGTIYPVAIKYDPKFGDAFWNSSEQSYMQYLAMMMTSWAIVCDVWYLPPMTMKEDEHAIDFANRVKAEIARKGGLVDLQWDGQLKRMKAKEEWRVMQQEEYCRTLKVD